MPAPARIAQLPASASTAGMPKQLASVAPSSGPLTSAAT
jgi:hypothetical protein